MIKTRRVGTFTLGIILVLIGVLFIIHLFVPALDYIVVFHLWPVILIMLGIEILVSLFVKGEDIVFKYDFAAIIMLFLIVGFSMCMAAVDFVITHEEIFVRLY